MSKTTYALMFAALGALLLATPAAVRDARVVRSVSTELAAVLPAPSGLEGQQVVPRPQAEGPDTKEEKQIAPGVQYIHMSATTPAGEPWSIHVLRVSRGEKRIEIRAVSAHDQQGEMQRELPTRMAAGAAGHREQVLGAVNGDYDLGEPYLGISDGLSVTSGRLWTTGKATWPAMALLKSGRPVIAAPQVRMELRVGKQKWTIGALNKPLGSGHGPEPRAFTREYRGTLKSETPFRGVVIGKIAPALPLRMNREVRGVVVRTVESTRGMTIEPGTVVVAQREIKGASKEATGSRASLLGLQKGAPVKLSFRAALDGEKNIRDVIGGFPIVVENGQRKIVGTPGESLSQRHPRTATCYNPRDIIFVVVDGRQPKLSVGMTLEELGDLMVSLGCTTAMNTDGGGSSVMAVTMEETSGGATTISHSELKIVNSPSDGRERGRGNAWVILRKR